MRRGLVILPPLVLAVVLAPVARSLPLFPLRYPPDARPAGSTHALPHDAQALACALEEWNRLPRAAASIGAPAAGAATGTVWKPLGPSPIAEPACCVTGVSFLANGRVNSIAVDPSDSDTIYLGSAGGGVWKSIDGGTTWAALTDHLISSGIGVPRAIAIDPSDTKTIYAGTGSFALLAQSLPRPIDYTQSRGILKSTDGGASWIALGSGFPAGNVGDAGTRFSRTNINAIIVDPDDSDTLYLAAGHGGSVDVRGGLFRSTNGGLDWSQGSGIGADGIAESLAVDTSSPAGARVLYAGVNGLGVLKSSDGGQTWVTVLSKTTQAVKDAGATGFGKVMVAAAPASSPANPAGEVVYVSLILDQIDNAGNPQRAAKIFVNTNGGAESQWQPRNAQIVGPTSQRDLLVGDAFSDMAVDPASPGDGANDTIYWGGATQFVSSDSAATFTEIGEIHGTHGDTQTFSLVKQPSGPSTIYVGDDGGIWRSTDGGATWTGTNQPGSPPSLNAGGLQIGTLYGLSAKQDAAASATLGAAQDSGRLLTNGSAVWTGTSDDGIDVVFDHNSVGDAYAIVNACDGDRLFKSTDSGVSWSDISGCTACNSPSGCTIPPNERGTFRNRLAVDPSNAGYLYVGGSAGSVFRTTDGGGSFQPLGQPALNKYVSSLAVAAADSKRLVLAANDVPLASDAVASAVFVTTDAFASPVAFSDLTRNLPTRFVTAVAFDPNDPETVYATLAGFGADTPGSSGHVYRTTLGGTEWVDVSPSVDVPFNSLLLDEGTIPAVLYAGTDLGVLRSLDAGGTWEVVDGAHLPNAAVSELDLNAAAGVLRISTWGRGVFELAAPAGPVILVSPGALDFGAACAGGADRTIDVANIGTQTLTIATVQRLFGSTSFTVLPSPQTPLPLAPGAHAAFTVRYTPASPAVPESASIRIASSDPGAPFVDLVATGTLETTPPTISAITATPSVLKPPNHKMRTVSLAVSASDDCDFDAASSCRIVAIASSEPPDGTGDGDTSPDWEITGNLTARLRAERAGNGPGRIYTLTVECSDSAGNSASGQATVAVPH